MTTLLKASLLGGTLVLSLMGAAKAQVVSYGDAGYPGEYGYGGPFVRGDYVGAPFTRVARPSELVPSAWGYGTYGIPTVAGIRQAPTGTPTVYVIDGPARAAAPRRVGARSRVLTRARDGRWSDAASRARPGFQSEAPRLPQQPPQVSGGARVVTVSVNR